MVPSRSWNGAQLIRPAPRVQAANSAVAVADAVSTGPGQLPDLGLEQ